MKRKGKKKEGEINKELIKKWKKKIEIIKKNKRMTVLLRKTKGRK